MIYLQPGAESSLSALLDMPLYQVNDHAFKEIHPDNVILIVWAKYRLQIYLPQTVCTGAFSCRGVQVRLTKTAIENKTGLALIKPSQFSR